MDAESAKIKNIIDMAFSFSAMTRVFRKDSAIEIEKELENILSLITSVKSEQDFKELHHTFCLWFKKNIKTAERNKDGMTIKPSGPASYGQGAKVLDVALHVYVHYCHLPEWETAERVTKWLNSAIDTKMLKYLKNMPDTEAHPIHATAIEDIDEKTYIILQKLLRRDIIRNPKFSVQSLPVQWDDIMWRFLNKK